MQKKWKAPKLELLDIKETLASFHGNTNDWTYIGRKKGDGGGPGEEPEPDPIGS